MTTLKIAFDRSARSLDADGRLHIARSHISKATINPYYGKEIVGSEQLGLDPEKIYQLFRDPVELERGAGTFARLPILSKHVPFTVDAPPKDLIAGTIGSEVTFNNPYLDADLCIWDAAAIAAIESDQIRELSCSYRYTPVMEPGEFEGRSYDGRMTNIFGNHLALVEIGRAGSDVLVADENIFFKESIMKMSKLGKALRAALSVASPTLAADAALPTLIGVIESQIALLKVKKIDKKEITSKLLAIDSQLDEIKLGDLIDTLVEMEQIPVQDNTPITPMSDPNPQNAPNMSDDDPIAEQLRSMLQGKVDDDLINKIIEMCSSPKPANDAEKEMDKTAMKKEDVDKAMDGLRKEMRAAEEARRDVREVVGDVFSMDSASEVYGFALDQMKVDRKDVEGTAALRALFKVAVSKSATRVPITTIAQDDGELVKQFPHIARFS